MQQSSPSSSPLRGPELISNVIYFNAANTAAHDNNDDRTEHSEMREVNRMMTQYAKKSISDFFSHINKRTQYERPGTSTTMSRYDALPTTATHKANGVSSSPDGQMSFRLSSHSIGQYKKTYVLGRSNLGVDYRMIRG
ncbi:hypothetical protein OSTOST_21524 [Ostertagia ostertagi]